MIVRAVVIQEYESRHALTMHDSQAGGKASVETHGRPTDHWLGGSGWISTHFLVGIVDAAVGGDGHAAAGARGRGDAGRLYVELAAFVGFEAIDAPQQSTGARGFAAGVDETWVEARIVLIEDFNVRDRNLARVLDDYFEFGESRPRSAARALALRLRVCRTARDLALRQHWARRLVRPGPRR